MSRILNSLGHTPIMLLAVAFASAAPASRADEKSEQAVEQFLSRLGLTDLQILHVERRFARATDAPRQQLGKQLADLYALRLMESADDKQAYDDIIARVDKLIRDVPAANTPALHVMILQADYNRAEKLILEWINDRRQPLEEASEILGRIAPLLDEHWRELAGQAEKLENELSELEDEARAGKEEELRRLNAVLARASYFAGWSNYYFGVTQQNPAAAQEQFDNGRGAFRRLFGLTDDDKYDDVDADFLGLESDLRSRALIGLGLCETALNNIDGARTCFKLLEHINTPPDIRDHIPFWFVSGLLQTGHLDEATTFATAQVGNFSGGATQGKVSFCATLIRAEYADPDQSTEQTRKLAELGIDGLARLRQLGVLRQILDKYKIKLGNDAGFYLQWVKGQQQFEQAETSKETSDHAAAANALESALKQPEARNDLASAAQCRFILAWCRYRLDEFEVAAKHFIDAMPALKESGETQKAVQAAWMAFASYHKLAQTQKRFVEQAIDAGKSLVREFPESPEAKKVGYYLAKLQQAAGKPSDRIKALKAVRANDPNYENSQYEICVLSYEVWYEIRSTQRDNATKATAAAKELLAAVDHYLSVAKNSSDSLRKLKCGLLAVDVSLRSSPADLSSAAKYLEIVEPFADSLPKSSSSVAEYHYGHFQLARLGNDPTKQLGEAQWLQEHAKGTSYERSAIIALAQSADQALQDAPQAEREQRRQRAIEIYRRLVQLEGDSPQAIGASKNARVANSRLAQYEFDAGQFQEAADRLDSLLAVDPQNRDYLRRAGLAKFHGKMYEASLPHWRKLLAGLPKGSGAWYEAKYHQLDCLLNTDRPAAEKVYRQFKVYYPEIKDANWRKKFEWLDRELAR